MKLDSIDLDSLEHDLLEKIVTLEQTLHVLEPDTNMEKIIGETLSFVKTFYDTVLRVKESYPFNTLFSSDKFSHILSMSDVNASFINNIQLLSKKLHVPVHIIMNVLMREVLLNRNPDSVHTLLTDSNFQNIKNKLFRNKIEIFLSNKEYLEVIDKDLTESNMIFGFRDIEILIFKDISEKVFQNKVSSIINCKIVFIPKNISKLLIYSKTKNVDAVNIYEALDDVYDAVFIFS